MLYNIFDGDTGEIILQTYIKDLAYAVALWIKRNEVDRNIWII